MLQLPEIFAFYNVTLRYRQICSVGQTTQYLQISEFTRINGWERAHERVLRLRDYIEDDLNIRLTRQRQDDQSVSESRSQTAQNLLPNNQQGILFQIQGSQNRLQEIQVAGQAPDNYALAALQELKESRQYDSAISMPQIQNNLENISQSEIDVEINRSGEKSPYTQFQANKAEKYMQQKENDLRQSAEQMYIEKSDIVMERSQNQAIEYSITNNQKQLFINNQEDSIQQNFDQNGDQNSIMKNSRTQKSTSTPLGIDKFQDNQRNFAKQQTQLNSQRPLIQPNEEKLAVAVQIEQVKDKQPVFSDSLSDQDNPNKMAFLDNVNKQNDGIDRSSVSTSVSAPAKEQRRIMNFLLSQEKSRIVKTVRVSLYFAVAVLIAVSAVTFEILLNSNSQAKTLFAVQSRGLSIMSSITYINKSMSNFFLQWYVPSSLTTRNKIYKNVVIFLKKYNGELYQALYDTNNWPYQQMLYSSFVQVQKISENGQIYVQSMSSFEALLEYGENIFEIINSTLTTIDTDIKNSYEQNFLNYISILNEVLAPLLDIQQQSIDQNISNQHSTLLVTVIAMEIVFFVALFISLPIYAHIRTQQNEIYNLFATISGKSIQRMQASHSRLSITYHLAIEKQTEKSYNQQQQLETNRTNNMQKNNTAKNMNKTILSSERQSLQSPSSTQLLTLKNKRYQKKHQSAGKRKMISQVEGLSKLSSLQLVLCIAAFSIASVYPIVNYFVTTKFQGIYKQNVEDQQYLMQASLNVVVWQDYVYTELALVFSGQLDLLNTYDQLQSTVDAQYQTYIEGLQNFQPNQPGRIQLQEYSDVYLKSSNENVCALLTNDPNVYLSLFAELNAYWASFGATNRYLRYQDSSSIPAFKNPQNLTGDAYQVAIFNYYCSNLGGQIATKGTVEMYIQLHQSAVDYQTFIDSNQMYWQQPNTFASKLTAQLIHESTTPINELNNLQMELQQLLTLLTTKNNDYCFSQLTQIQSYLFILGVIVIVLIFIIGGEVFVSHSHNLLYTTTRSLSILSYEIIKENPYLNSYLFKKIRIQ